MWTAPHEPFKNSALCCPGDLGIRLFADCDISKIDSSLIVTYQNSPLRCPWRLRVRLSYIGPKHMTWLYAISQFYSPLSPRGVGGGAIHGPLPPQVGSKNPMPFVCCFCFKIKQYLVRYVWLFKSAAAAHFIFGFSKFLHWIEVILRFLYIKFNTIVIKFVTHSVRYYLCRSPSPAIYLYFALPSL